MASRSHDRMLILSDPAATGFCVAMGAVHETDIEVSPGFSIAKLWYHLEQRQPSHPQRHSWRNPRPNPV